MYLAQEKSWKDHREKGLHGFDGVSERHCHFP